MMNVHICIVVLCTYTIAGTRGYQNFKDQRASDNKCVDQCTYIHGKQNSHTVVYRHA